MPTCRPAPSLLELTRQADARAPGRSDASDGICASAQHTAQNPGSDHEPHVVIDGTAYATAKDLTDDKAGGMDADAWADWLVETRHPAVKYVIRNREMASSYPARGYPAWTWRPYTGPNPHVSHTHVSIHPTAAAVFYDGPWFPSEDDDMATWKDWSDDEKREAAGMAATLVVAALEERGVFDQLATVRESVAGRRKPTSDNPDTRSATGRIEAGVNALVEVLVPKPPPGG